MTKDLEKANDKRKGSMSTALEVQKRKELALELQKAKPRIMRLFPKYVSDERMMALLGESLRGNDEIRKCSPVSIINCMIIAAREGLELNGPHGGAYMIPRAGEAVFQFGYQGLLTQVMKTGLISTINFQTIKENDEVTYAQGSDPKLYHKPALYDRGKTIAYYAIAYPSDRGQAVFHVLTKEEAEKHRAHFKGGYAWGTDFDAMAMKTAFLMLAKRLPKASESLMKTENAVNNDAMLATSNVIDTDIVDTDTGEVTTA